MNPYKQLLTWVATITEARDGIGALMIKARQDKGLSQAELAKALNVSTVHVSNIETGKGYPSLELLKKLLELIKP